MDEDEIQKQKSAVQSFKEFTGNQDELTARRLLSLFDWDIQRAINNFFMRGLPPQQFEEGQKNVERGDETIVVDDDEEEDDDVEIQSIYPTTSVEPKRRISHYVKRNNKNFVDKVQKDDKNEQKHDNKIDDNLEEEENIRAPIPAVKGVMLAQTFHETYGDFPRPTISIFDQFRSLPSNKNTSESGEELMEESAKTSTSSSSQQVKYRQRAALSPPTNSFKKIKLYHRTIEEAEEKDDNKKHENNNNQNDRQLDNNVEEKEQKEEEIEETALTTKGGFGHGIKKRRDLRLLFRPPTDLIFYGNWDLALQTARQSRLWLLVNVQNSSEFACAVLNRDVWSDETVKDVIKTNFLFWQVYHDSADGTRVRCYYHFENYPALFIIDPRTGEEVLKLTAPDSVTFLDNLTTFLARYPTFETRDQEFKQMALLGSKHPFLCNKNGGLLLENKSKSSSIIGHNSTAASSSSSDSCGKKRKQPSDDDYILDG